MFKCNINLSWIRNKMIMINLMLDKDKKQVTIYDIQKEVLRHLIDSSLHPKSIIDSNYFNKEIIKEMLGEDVNYTHTNRIQIQYFYNTNTIEI